MLTADDLEALEEAAEGALIYCSCGRDFASKSTFLHHATSANKRDKARSDSSIIRRPLWQHEQTAVSDLKCLGKGVKKKDCPACSARVDTAQNEARYELDEFFNKSSTRCTYAALLRAVEKLNRIIPDMGEVEEIVAANESEPRAVRWCRSCDNWIGDYYVDSHDEDCIRAVVDEALALHSKEED